MITVWGKRQKKPKKNITSAVAAGRTTVRARMYYYYNAQVEAVTAVLNLHEKWLWSHRYLLDRQSSAPASFNDIAPASKHLYNVYREKPIA